MSHVARFVDLYTASSSGWFGPSPMTRAAQSATLVLYDREDLAAALPDAHTRLSESLHWFSALRGAIGDSLLPLALVRGVDPADLPDRTAAVLARFKAHRLPRLAQYPVAAAAWLALQDEQDDAVVARMAAILGEWKKDHPLITSANDLHAAALHAVGPHAPGEIRGLVERRYLALRQAGFTWAPGTLQRAAQLAALRPSVGAAELADRYARIAEHRVSAGDRVRGVEREAMVLLANSPGDAAELARAYRSADDALARAKGLGRPLRAVLAAGLVAADQGAQADDALQSSNLAAISALQVAAMIVAGTATAS